MLASDFAGGAEGLSTAVTQLKSPLFKGNEHFLECFSFWFYFGVSFSFPHLFFALLTKES